MEHIVQSGNQTPEPLKPRSKARLPIIPLSYKNKDAAILQEFIVDYDDKKLYAKHPLTGEIIEFTKNMSEVFNTTELDIEYTGAVNVLPKRMMLDYKSLNQVNYGNLIQLNGFDTALGDQMVYKGLDGNLLWTNVWDKVRSSMYRESIHECNVTLNDTIVIDPEFINRTVAPLTPATLVITTNSAIPVYCKTIWNLSVETMVDITFPNYIIWENLSDMQIAPNSINIYTFETWDSGVTWIGSKQKTNSSTEIDTDYLNTNYYTKSQVEAMMAFNIKD